MSIFNKHYYEAKKLGEKIGWSQAEIHVHTIDCAVDEITKLTRELVDVFNSSYHEEIEQAVLAGINTTHRTIQAEFWNGMKNVMLKYSQQDETMFFDPRNLHCREITRRMAIAFSDTDYAKEESV